MNHDFPALMFNVFWSYLEFWKYHTQEEYKIVKETKVGFKLYTLNKYKVYHISYLIFIVAL